MCYENCTYCWSCRTKYFINWVVHCENYNHDLLKNILPSHQIYVHKTELKAISFVDQQKVCRILFEKPTYDFTCSTCAEKIANGQPVIFNWGSEEQRIKYELWKM